MKKKSIYKIFYTIKYIKIASLLFMSFAAFGAGSGSGAGSPDFSGLIDALELVAKGRPLSATHVLTMQSFMFDPTNARHLLGLLQPPSKPILGASMSSVLELEGAEEAAATAPIIGGIDGSEIPLENRGNSFDSFIAASEESAKKLALARAFVETPLVDGASQFMYWYGPAGRGKTHLATASANAFSSQGKKVLLLSATDIHNYFSRKLGSIVVLTTHDPMKYFGGYDVVIIDDLNKIDVIHAVYLRGLLIDIAFNKGNRKIIITSNMPFETFLTAIISESGGTSLAISAEATRFQSRITALLGRSPEGGIIDFSTIDTSLRK